jgi:hypothetical protein
MVIKVSVCPGIKGYLMEKNGEACGLRLPVNRFLVSQVDMIKWVE